MNLTDEQYKQIGIIALDGVLNSRQINRAYSLSPKHGNAINNIIQQTKTKMPKRKWWQKLVQAFKVWEIKKV